VQTSLAEGDNVKETVWEETSRSVKGELSAPVPVYVILR